MENLTEKHIVAFLKERRGLIAEELKKIENIISAIESSNRILSGIATPSAQSKPKPLSVSPKKLERITEFNPKGKLDSKISYALSKAKTGFKEDIIKVLMEMQPEQDISKLQNAVGVRLSYLLKNGAIEGEKRGRKYSYTLK